MYSHQCGTAAENEAPRAALSAESVIKERLIKIPRNPSFEVQVGARSDPAPVTLGALGLRLPPAGRSDGRTDDLHQYYVHGRHAAGECGFDPSRCGGGR